MDNSMELSQQGTEMLALFKAFFLRPGSLSTSAERVIIQRLSNAYKTHIPKGRPCFSTRTKARNGLTLFRILVSDSNIDSTSFSAVVIIIPLRAGSSQLITKSNHPLRNNITIIRRAFFR